MRVLPYPTSSTSVQITGAVILGIRGRGLGIRHARPMAELKTKPTGDDAREFVDSIEDPAVRADCEELVEMMSAATGAPPVMWGSSIVGFGNVHYRYASGREGDWFAVGFSPRKRNLTLYVMDGVDSHADQLERLGKHTTGKGCLYVKRLDDIDRSVLNEIISDAAAAS